MSGITGNTNNKSGIIGIRTNNYLNSQTFAQTDGFVDYPHFYGFKFLGYTSAGATGVTLAVSSCGFAIGNSHDGGSYNRRGFWFWKRCNGGSSYYNTVVEMHISGVGGSQPAMAISLDSSHVVTINTGNLFVYTQSG